METTQLVDILENFCSREFSFKKFEFPFQKFRFFSISFSFFIFKPFILYNISLLVKSPDLFNIFYGTPTQKKITKARLEIIYFN